MMRAPAVIVDLILTLQTGLAGAQSPDAAACTASLQRLAQVTGVSPIAAIAAEAQITSDGWCGLSDVTIPTNSKYLSFGIDDLQWRGTDMARFAAGGLPPTALDVRLTGFRFLTNTGDPVMTYLMAQQSGAKGISGDLSLIWDAGSSELEMTALNLDFPGENTIAVTARFRGVDLTSRATMQQSVGGFALTKAKVDVLTNGLFETYLLLPFGQLVLGGAEDPAAQVAALKAAASDQISSFPNPPFMPGSTDALTQLITDMPNPTGRIVLDIDAPNGLGPAQTAKFALFGIPQSLDEVWPLFGSAQISVTYAPTAP